MEPYRPAYVHNYDIDIIQGQDWVMGFRALPRSDQNELYLQDTTGYTASMKVRDEDWDGSVVLEASTTDGRIQVGFTPASVDRNTAYNAGQKVVPIALNGFVYECTASGTTHASNEPTWPTTIGGTVSDGTVTWRCETTDDLVANVYITIPAAVTELLDDWGRGVWSLEVVDDFSHSWLFVDGIARLRREATY